MRAHPEPIGYVSPVARTPFAQPPSTTTTVLFAVPLSQRSEYTGGSLTRFFAFTGSDAIAAIATAPPRVLLVDWDEPALGAADICAAARTAPNTGVLVTTAQVEEAPAILRAGCHGVLLKPFPPNLLAARLGRIIKETERLWGQRTRPAGWQVGTNRVWPETACPECNTGGATSFDFSSHRRVWYACLACDHTWLGPRQE